MGRGSSKVDSAARMQRIRQLQKDLATAKRQVTRAENDYRSKRIDADYYGGNSLHEQNKRLDLKTSAKKKYDQAVKKRDALQAQYDKLTKKNRRRDTSGPLF